MFLDGTGVNVEIGQGYGIVFASSTTAYFVDQLNYAIRKIAISGGVYTVTTIVGPTASGPSGSACKCYVV